MESIDDKPKVLCCECGVLIDQNPLNTCIHCIQSRVDITEGMVKQSILQFCDKCERYLQPPNTWITASLESRQLLSVCLKRVKGLNKLHLVDAGFIWTEPHSKRLKIKAIVQKDVGGATLQQTAIIEFTIVNQICETCQRVEAKDFWNAVVQVRQRVEHKKTFYYLEQLILKSNMHKTTVQIKQVHEGIDFFYATIQDARKMVDFLETVVPCRYQTSKRLISHDIHSNTYNNKHSFSLEIVPVCKDTVVCLPPRLSKEYGSIGPICICFRVTRNLHLIDPKTLKVIEIDANIFWRSPFTSLCSPKQLREFTVMDIELIDPNEKSRTLGKESKKHVLADCWVMKNSDMGKNDKQYHTKTHLGHLLNIGDSALGFDLTNSNINDENVDNLKPEDLPDIILMKKLYGDKQKRHKKRNWKLNRLNIEDEHNNTADERDYTEFMEDIEEDITIRENINIYKDASKITVETDDESTTGGVPQISFEEMLDDLNIQD